MSIDLDSETLDITNKLKQVEGYLDCERIIMHNIKNLLRNGCNDENIIIYLENLSAWFDKKIEADQHKADCTNYRYAVGFVDILLRMPQWKNWMKTIDMEY